MNDDRRLLTGADVEPEPDMTAAMRLCDEAGLVSDEPVDAESEPATTDASYIARLNRLRGVSGFEPYEGDPFPCAGSAHLAGAHIRCTSPAHTPPVAQKTWTIYVCPGCERWYGDSAYDDHDGGWLCAGRPPERHPATGLRPITVAEVGRSEDDS